MVAWGVFLNGKNIDTIFTNEKCDGGASITAEMVKDGLVNHDGYNPDITVRKVR